MTTTLPPMVAHVITESVPPSRAQRATLPAVAGLRRAGYRVELICGPGGPLIDGARNADLPVHVVSELAPGAGARRDARALLRLYALCRSRSYDIVHTHSTRAGWLGRPAAWMAGVPVIVHTVDAAPFEVRHGAKSLVFAALERLAATLTDHLVRVGEATLVGADQMTSDLARLYDDLLASRRPSDDAPALWETLRRI